MNDENAVVSRAAELLRAHVQGVPAQPDAEEMLAWLRRTLETAEQLAAQNRHLRALLKSML